MHDQQHAEAVRDATLKELARQWSLAKAAEAEAVKERRDLEDAITALLSINPQDEGTVNHKGDGYRIKVTLRHNTKIDADLVQEIAAEHGTSEHLAHLFRWKPEINVSRWKGTDEKITAPLLKAITVTPGRPSYSIETGA